MCRLLQQVLSVYCIHVSCSTASCQCSLYIHVSLWQCSTASCQCSLYIDVSCDSVLQQVVSVHCTYMCLVTVFYSKLSVFTVHTCVLWQCSTASCRCSLYIHVSCDSVLQQVVGVHCTYIYTCVLWQCSTASCRCSLYIHIYMCLVTVFYSKLSVFTVHTYIHVSCDSVLQQVVSVHCTYMYVSCDSVLFSMLVVHT